MNGIIFSMCKFSTLLHETPGFSIAQCRWRRLVGLSFACISKPACEIDNIMFWTSMLASLDVLMLSSMVPLCARNMLHRPLVLDQTYRFVEHAGLSVLVFALRTVDETVAQHVIVYTSVPALPIRRGTGKTLHTIHRGWTFCNGKEEKRVVFRLQLQIQFYQQFTQKTGTLIYHFKFERSILINF